MKKIAILLTLLLGCETSTGIVEMDADTYMVAIPQSGYGPPTQAQAQVYREANAFCAKQAKKVETIDLKLTDPAWGRQASATLHFRCVPESSLQK